MAKLIVFLSIFSSKFADRDCAIMRSIYTMIFQIIFLVNALCWCLCSGRPFVLRSKASVRSRSNDNFRSLNDYVSDSSPYGPLFTNDNDDDDEDDNDDDDDDSLERSLNLDILQSAPYTRTAIFSKLYQWALQEVAPESYISRNKKTG